MSNRYPLSPGQGGIFATVQGEGSLSGLPSVFIRLAGCSVQCPACDTDYRVDRRVTADEIAVEAVELLGSTIRHIWITGGEPTDHDLDPLRIALRQRIGKVYIGLGLATSGVRAVPFVRAGWDYLCVSPHGTPEQLVQRSGYQVNLVPGLNGLRLADWVDAEPELHERFGYRYVTPLYGSAESLSECLKWVRAFEGWRLGHQSHKAWNLP